MKIRTGFVSNSSSSSFIAIGFKIEENKKNMYTILKNICKLEDSKIEEMTKNFKSNFWEYISEEYDSYPVQGEISVHQSDVLNMGNNGIVIGKIIEEWSDDPISNVNVDIDKYLSDIKDIQNKYNLQGNIRLIAGDKNY